MKKWMPVAAGIVALLLGVALFGGLTAYGKSREIPAPAREEETLHVRAVPVDPQDYPVTITGFGEVAARREVSIAPEVPGRVIEIHPSFKAGGQVNGGDVLFRIDPSTYDTQLAEAEAALRQQEAALDRVRREWENEKARQGALEQTAAIAERDMARAEELARKGVGSKAEVDKADGARVEAGGQRDLHARELGVFPVRVREMEAAVDTARAALTAARQNLDRTQVKAPFTGRIATKLVDTGQFVAAGLEAARLADDSVLEMVTPIDSGEARRWLRFASAPAADGTAWFPEVEPVECTLRWTEDETGTTWTGTLERVAGYDPGSRMVQLVVSYRPSPGSTGFPLVSGMFCRVDIPGKPLEGVFRVPKESVTFDSYAYTAVEGRLKMVPVQVAREEDGFAYVNLGLAPGDVVITTRLVDPLENSLLKVDLSGTIAVPTDSAS